MAEYINRLFDGMHSDNHPVNQPPNTYEKGLNGLLVTDGKNNFSFESQKGTSISFSLPDHASGQTKFIPIGVAEFTDRLIVWSTNDNTAAGAEGEIGEVTFDEEGVGTYTPKYYHDDLDFSKKNPIEGVAFRENDSIERVYWGDNNNQPRVLNLASSILNTTIASGSLVVGNQYMVLTNGANNSIVHNAVTYGPGEPATNIFTAVNANYTGSATVIAYLDINLLNFVPEKRSTLIDFDKWITGGSLNCGVKQYFFRLETDDGYQSGWSTGSRPIHIGPDSPSAGYEDYQGDGEGQVLADSGKGIRLTISDINTEFDTISVAVAQFDQVYNTIRNLSIFSKTSISGSSMSIDHVGNENLEAILVDDLLVSDPTITKNKCMATIKNYLIIANYEERAEFSTAITATASTFVYATPSDDKGLATASLENGHGYLPEAGVASGGILPDGRYKVTVRNVTYNAVEYGPNSPATDDVFVGVTGVTTYTNGTGSGTPIVQGCIRIKRYDKFAGGASYKDIVLKDDFFDHKGMASSRYQRSYWRGETYRVGFLPYDKFGNPMFVRWLDDITIEEQSDSSGSYGLVKQSGNDHDGEFSLNLVGIQIDSLDLSDIIDDISGFSIVRAVRDRQILGQGLMMPTVINGTKTHPISSIRLDYDHWHQTNAHRPFTFLVDSPEMLFEQEGLGVEI